MLGEAVLPLCCLFGLRRPIASMVWLKSASKKIHSNMCLPGLLLPVPMFLYQATAETFAWDPQTLTGGPGSVFCGFTAPFPCILVHTRFCWCTPRLCFPHSCGNPVIKSHCPSKSDSLGIPSAFCQSPGWEVKNKTMNGYWILSKVFAYLLSW